MQNEFKLKLVHTNTVLDFLFAKNYDSTKEKNTQVGEKEGFFFNEENVKFKILLVKKQVHFIQASVCSLKTLHSYVLFELYFSFNAFSLNESFLVQTS